MILPGTRLLLVIFSGLTLLAFIVLFGLADATERDFAWTIKPPATAAFLGVAYAAGCLLVVLALRKGTWAALRIPFLTILVFVIVTLVATLLHLDRLHFGSEVLAARYAAYFWMGVYLLVPPAMVAVLVSRNAGPPRCLTAAHAARPGGDAAGPGPAAAGGGIGPVRCARGGHRPVAVAVDPAHRPGGGGLAAGVRAVRHPGLAQPGPGPARCRGVGVRAAGPAGGRRHHPVHGTVEWSTPAIWVYLALAASILASSAYALVRLRRTGPRERLGPGERAADTVVQ